MPTLKEIKGRIASVRSTLKITSAMKLVSSAKLRKAQNAVEALRPYEAELQRALALVMPDPDRASASALVAIASNSALCGGFNANVIAKVRAVRRPGDIVYSVGRKMADAMRRDGFPSPEDFTGLAEHPSYSQAAALVDRLSEDFAAGRIGSVTLVYTHFVSSARQIPVTEVLLTVTPGPDRASAPVTPGPDRVSPDPIIEPSREELLGLLYPKVLRLKLYAALLDSAAAEHAARTVAMQTASDNAENLLSELTLQYNKGRQQKITSEILDLAGGQAE